MKTGWPNASSQCGQSSSEVVFAYSPEFNYSSFDISPQICNNYKVAIDELLCDKNWGGGAWVSIVPYLKK